MSATSVNWSTDPHESPDNREPEKLARRGGEKCEKLANVVFVVTEENTACEICKHTQSEPKSSVRGRTSNSVATVDAVITAVRPSPAPAVIAL